MKKDIHIPTPTGFQLAIIPQQNQAWDLYIINKNEHSLQNILIVTEASGEEKISSKLRYFLESIPPISFIKFETVYGEVAALSNLISVTYYVGLDIYEKEFSFRASELTKPSLIPILDMEGHSLE
ncbi:MAG: hypothetical protein JNL75_08280 [Chitinophagales bacterium]|nr:hypothetical protein [Chitinophagales bacterium]